MRFCMVIAGGKAFSENACTAAERLGYRSLSTESGFHRFSAGDGDSVSIAIIDMETMPDDDIAGMMKALAEDRQLLLFCPTPEDSAKLMGLLSDFTGFLPMMPINPAA